MQHLGTYRKKRNFEHTREPKGAQRSKAGFAFVIQKHAARRLHYDFRLQLDGVLLSWAVPKGPSLDPKVKRLAVQTEAHPLEYAKFEGEIPKGEYGAGTVEIWDHGSWTPESEPHEQYRKGHLTFTLEGERLHGRWHLIRRGPEAGEKSHWLLFKGHDEAHAAHGTPATPGELPGTLSPLPTQVEVQRPTLVKEVPTGADWIHEIKLDGYRIVARLEQGNVSLLSRNGGDWTARAPKVAETLAKLGVESALLDGELVVLREDGVSEFQQLQNALQQKDQTGLVYSVFDLLYLNGHDLRVLSLLERKQLLERLLARLENHDTVRYNGHVHGDGTTVFERACELGLEGVVSKRAAAPYRSGKGSDWVKTKCLERQEFVIGGYTEPSGSRRAFGALLVGVWADEQLRYAGKVGTGFSEQSLRELKARLLPLTVKQSPFANPPRGAEARGVHWVKPTQVAELSFTEFTRDGKLRHPVFQGLREDKPAREVSRERAKRPPTTASSTIQLTHPERVMYPKLGIQKREVLAYYQGVAEFMLPHVSGRPLTLVRCPEGEGGSRFFQKHAQPGSPAGIHRIAIEEESGKGDYVYIDGVDGLLGLVQMSALEIHTWGSHREDVEHPDLLVLDLDPAPEVEFTRVISAAELLRQLFDKLSLESFVKTTGGKGLHVCVPLEPKLSWDEAKEFTHALAEALVKHAPDEFVAVASKARRKGKIFVDYLRNGRGATFVAPYSTRARPEATVATPLLWTELDGLEPERFTMDEVLRRVQDPEGDRWRTLPGVRQQVSRSLTRSLRGVVSRLA
ncbi:MAG TPA: DNA ligase D [Polyangiaceae bacterium]|nr:DNA ligase D [Polyangiaceae bacterium]